MDVLESGNERAADPWGVRLRRGLAHRPPRWALAVLAVAVVAGLVGGVAAVRAVQAERAREAVRVDVELLADGVSSSTVRGVARGRFSVLLVNRRERPVRLEDLRVDVPGLEVLDVEPGPGAVLAGSESRYVRVAFVVPDCSRLELPGSVTASLAVEGGPVVERRLPVSDAADAGTVDQVRLGACPDSARADPPGSPTDLSVRPVGGWSERSGAGAEGVALLEVRNGGAAVELLYVDAEVPGVGFTQRRLGDGRTLVPDEAVVLRLAFRIEDCAQLERIGRLVVRVERSGGVQELGLRLTAEPLAGAGPQVDLRVVLDACR